MHGQSLYIEQMSTHVSCSKPSYLFLLLPVIVWQIQNLNYVYEAQ